MLFTAPIFLFGLLPATLLGAAIIGRLLPNGLVVWLLLASMVFYAWWSPAFLALFCLSTLANWVAGHAIARRLPLTWSRWAVLVVGLIWNLGLLAYFKYADFLIGIADDIGGVHWPLRHIILPLGISFFTFQKIAYLVDIYRGKAEPGRLLEFALFVFFFPQLIAGPIVHHAEIMPQLRILSRRYDDQQRYVDDLAVGFTLLLIGLVKKVVIADQLAPGASPVFELAANGCVIGFALAAQAVLSFTGQLYFDFSGYSDMAIGLARMFGVRLPANFNSPYQATSIIDFWRRWHMTLSRFLRDYLYIPLGGSRVGAVRRYGNLMIVMLIGGLWHGAGWTFVVWGGLHGLYLLVAHLWRALGPLPVQRWLGWALTLAGVMVAWILFRASNLATAHNLLSGLAGLHGFYSQVPFPEKTDPIIRAVLALALAFLAPNSQQIMRHYHVVLGAPPLPSAPWQQVIVWRPSKLAAVLSAAAIVATVLFSWKTSEFLYFQF
jgi:D-alanyl-lipoteichoic acid acyltransferase DltB (MBOAT superfamily)